MELSVKKVKSRARRTSGRRIISVLAILGGLCLLFPGGCHILYRKIGGNFRGEPSEMWGALSPGARRLVESSFDSIDPDKLADFHVHVAGFGNGDSGIYLNPDWLSFWHPIKRGRTMVYISASGVEPDGTDRDYVLRLVELIRSVPGHGRFFLLALDRRYRQDGTMDLEKTSVSVPNEYVFQMAREFPDLFVPVISVHPYRPDALEELEKWARQGCRHVKWIPNAMGIDPSHPKTEPFYLKMKALDMILMSHTGDEQALDAHEQHLGNPLLLRKPLDMGVTVVALHSASIGRCIDLESPERKRVPAFDLFLRLMDEPAYEGRLFGEISATTFSNHLGDPILRLLEREDLHDRLVNGSDYPLPAINVVTRTGQLANEGFISDEERGYLDEIYGYNPLLFDFVVKRTVRHPVSGKRFSPSVFLVPPELAPR